ncbi:hypothetical protein BDZ97DRAFT_1755755 [Flammula alnicola]|nr:hypothetical protein BDZ97DRAFT_1755755 [Flammula alnicola]
MKTDYTFTGKNAGKASKTPEEAAAQLERQYKATTNLPDCNSKFNVAAGGSKPGHTFAGKDVHQAVFESHAEAQRLKDPGLSKTQAKKSPLKSFSNRPHEVPKPNGGNKPLPQMTVDKNHPHKPPGREFPLGDPKNLGPARVITQKTKGGHQTFRGVIAHDQSRARTPGPGYNDHFQVKESKPKKKSEPKKNEPKKKSKPDELKDGCLIM